MLLAPVSHAANCFIASEVVATEAGAPPAALTGRLTGLTTSRCRTVMLVMAVTVIGRKELPATTALAPTGLATHRGPSRKKMLKKSNPKDSSEEDARRRRKKSFRGE